MGVLTPRPPDGNIKFMNDSVRSDIREDYDIARQTLSAISLLRGMEDSESDSGRRSHLAVSTLDTKTAGTGEKWPRGTPWRARKTQR
ncbi:hypothetical protein RRG08_066593 [Elysia crispata]|uniref:Uncharacterized protein n=1 Tax=Elysia crispata TaxID=231223 RepID=A0AAE0XV22_9GAST|nr:hypothetical protein RRG08_066593 [Elysia crispata]